MKTEVFNELQYSKAFSEGAWQRCEFLKVNNSEAETIGSHRENVGNNPIHTQKGFTLIELVIVLAVLGVLTSIAIPQFIGIQERAEVTALTSEVTTLLAEADAQTRVRPNLSWDTTLNCASVEDNGVALTDNTSGVFDSDGFNLDNLLDNTGLTDIPAIDINYTFGGNGVSTRSEAEDEGAFGAYFVIPARVSTTGSRLYCPAVE